MSNYILALDQGSSASRAVLFDDEGNAVSQARRELGCYCPQSGWMEQQPMEIWSGQYAAMMEAAAKGGIRWQELAAVGIAAQRGTTILWEKATGRPIYNAISGQCRRTAPLVRELVRQGLDEHIRRVTGLVPDAGFPATKIRWILDTVPGAQQRAEKGELLFGTVGTWLVWKLTGGRVHAMDRSCAAYTMLYDSQKMEWDEVLLNALRIPREVLPEICPSGHVYGSVNIGGREIPLTALSGDQNAALFGQCCFDRGQAKCTFGSGCVLMTGTGKKRVHSISGLLTGLACGTDGEEPEYLLEGCVFDGGSLIDWLRGGLHLIESNEEAQYAAQKVPDHGGVYLVPALSGMAAPRWDMQARGCIVGMTRGTRREHIIRAAEESIAFRCADLIHAAEADLGRPLTEIRVDGGGVQDHFLMQLEADLSGRTLRCPPVPEAAAQGAACLAGLAVGVWTDRKQLSDLWSSERRFDPAMDEKIRLARLRGWHRAVERGLDWEEV